MATRYCFGPLQAEFPTSNFPQLEIINLHPVLSFDAGTDETCYWTAIAPQNLTGTITAVAFCMMASATSGSVYMQGALEAVTPADALDLDTSTSFDSANSGNATVPGTAGYLFTISITMTNADSIAAGDLFRLRLNRDADNASDTATGDCRVLCMELRDSA